MTADEQGFLTKAEEGLAVAEAAFAAGQFTGCARNAYYAAYQAAIVALLAEGIVDKKGEWGHAFVQAAFVQQLINQRKVYPGSVRSTLAVTLRFRIDADYSARPISRREADGARRQAYEFIGLIKQRLQANNGGER